MAAVTERVRERSPSRYRRRELLEPLAAGLGELPRIRDVRRYADDHARLSTSGSRERRRPSQLQRMTPNICRPRRPESSGKGAHGGNRPFHPCQSAPPAAAGASASGAPWSPTAFRDRKSSTSRSESPGPLHDREQRRHARDLLALLLQEPVQELLADEVVLLARELDEARDLLRDRLLLRERERDRLGRVLERRLRLGRRRGSTTSSPASRRYWTSIIAWFRSSTACR